MLKIGYVRLRDQESPEATASLKASGCHVVRAEEPGGPEGDHSAVLYSILDFIGPGDQLVVRRLDHLARSSRQLLEVIDRLDTRGASLQVVDFALTTEGEAGRALRAALEAVAQFEPPSVPRRRRAPPAGEIVAMQKAGVAPGEIARRLGVSRMTVWRKLKAVDA